MVKKKHQVLILLIIILPVFLRAETPLLVDFYGIKSDTTDASMIDMTQNLYLAQLKVFNNITVTDLRKTTIPDVPEEGHLVFYIEIKNTGEESKTWLCTFIIRAHDSSKNIMVSEQYNSYYKILTEAKKSLEDIFGQLQNPRKNEPNSQSSDETPMKEDPVHASTESIAGTWKGEEYIAKIIILRGGRGFIIYKNGASMNVTVNVINRDKILITQAGSANASFFPDLPRKIALDNATSALPIEWTLSLRDTQTMIGEKKTLINDPNSASGATEGTVSVTWTKLQ